jgi:hypothetical protein
MARVFISHSSKDKEFARRLAGDIQSVGHDAWLDEWEIKVGDCIVSGVQKGLEDSTHVALVLSPDAVKSGWVEREWKDAYWQEVTSNRVILLPVLIAPCDIPRLLGSRKYADFTSSYEKGLMQLAQALPPGPEAERAELARETAGTEEITALIAQVQDRGSLLSVTLAKVLSFALAGSHSDLMMWCRGELGGWDDDAVTGTRLRSYRSYDAFLSFGMVNTGFFGWGDNASTMLTYMEAHPTEFFRRRIVVGESVGRIESRAVPHGPKSFLSGRLRLGDVKADAEKPDTPVFYYARSDSYSTILENIRTEAVQRLLTLVPSTQEPTAG